MISAISIISVFGIIVFLSGAACGVFILLIVSMRRTPGGPLSETTGERNGSVSRRVLTATRVEGKELIK